MTYALEASVLAMGLAVAASAAPPLGGGATLGAREPVRATFLPTVTRRDQGAARRALDLARARLASPECAAVYADFELPQGGTPQDVLDRMGIAPEDLLETLVFNDGSRDRACQTGRAALTTTVGSSVINVCPSFFGLSARNRVRSAALVIHESLHVLGLGENPPTSNEITSRVERRCWKTAKRVSPLRVGPGQ